MGFTMADYMFVRAHTPRGAAIKHEVLDRARLQNRHDIAEGDVPERIGRYFGDLSTAAYNQEIPLLDHSASRKLIGDGLFVLTQEGKQAPIEIIHRQLVPGAFDDKLGWLAMRETKITLGHGPAHLQNGWDVFERNAASDYSPQSPEAPTKVDPEITYDPEGPLDHKLFVLQMLRSAAEHLKPVA